MILHLNATVESFGKIAADIQTPQVEKKNSICQICIMNENDNENSLF